MTINEILCTANGIVGNFNPSLAAEKNSNNQYKKKNTAAFSNSTKSKKSVSLTEPKYKYANLIELTDKTNDFYVFKFLCNAINKFQINIDLLDLYADAKSIVATDSRRLHKIDNENLLKPGFYKILTNTSKKIILSKIPKFGNFPNYKKVIPKKYIKTIKLKKMNYIKLLTCIIKNLDKKDTINPLFVKDILHSNDKTGIIHISNSELPIVIKIQTLYNPLAVLMPMKYKE